MTYTIKLVNHTETPSEVFISTALEFRNVLSREAIIDIFAQNNIPHVNGVFKSKKLAEIVAERIRLRGAFGGFGRFIGAVVVKN